MASRYPLLLALVESRDILKLADMFSKGLITREMVEERDRDGFSSLQKAISVNNHKMFILLINIYKFHDIKINDFELMSLYTTSRNGIKFLKTMHDSGINIRCKISTTSKTEFYHVDYNEESIDHKMVQFMNSTGLYTFLDLDPLYCKESILRQSLWDYRNKKIDPDKGVKNLFVYAGRKYKKTILDTYIDLLNKRGRKSKQLTIDIIVEQMYKTKENLPYLGFGFYNNAEEPITYKFYESFFVETIKRLYNNGHEMTTDLVKAKDLDLVLVVTRRLAFVCKVLGIYAKSRNKEKINEQFSVMKILVDLPTEILAKVLSFYVPHWYPSYSIERIITSFFLNSLI